jgi:hypothetical protein
MGEPKIFVNVPVGSEDAKRIAREETFWTGPRLFGLTVVTLGIALVVLYVAANTTSETTWSDWLLPF